MVNGDDTSIRRTTHPEPGIGDEFAAFSGGIAQLELLLEEQEISAATPTRPESEASREKECTSEPSRKTSWHPLPAHLFRAEIDHPQPAPVRIAVEFCAKSARM